jgi:hypothetical protein
MAASGLVTTLPGCTLASECPCFWSGSTNAVSFDALDGDYGEFYRQIDPNAVDGFVVARDESLGHPTGSIVASFVTLGDAPVPVGTTGSFPVFLTGELGAEAVIGGYTSLPFEGTGVGTTAVLTENDGDVLAGTVGGSVFVYDPLPGGTVVPFQLTFRITRDPADGTPDVPYCTIIGGP